MCAPTSTAAVDRTLAALALLAVAVAAGCGPRHVVGADPCAGRDDAAVVVKTADHMLWLCANGTASAHYAVSLGKGGSGKSVEGDDKTPMGTYSLGAPVPSKRFGTFIPVGYPTAEQAKEGKTGGSVGVHGPARAMRWAGRLLLMSDWTKGCVGLPRDSDLKSIVEFVETKHAQTIVFE
jgi:murein L,D-transpeptidase YafK